MGALQGCASLGCGQNGLVGEFELIAAIRARLPEAGPRVLLGSGDDAAVTSPGAVTATSVDAIVEGVHFRRPQLSPEGIGRRALATALSDLAAMGAVGRAWRLGYPVIGEAECRSSSRGSSRCCGDRIDIGAATSPLAHPLRRRGTW